MEPSPPGTEAAWWAGVVLQAAVLGVGLFLASLRLLEVATEAHVFRYQGF